MALPDYEYYYCAKHKELKGDSIGIMAWQPKRNRQFIKKWYNTLRQFSPRVKKQIHKWKHDSLEISDFWFGIYLFRVAIMMYTTRKNWKPHISELLHFDLEVLTFPAYDSLQGSIMMLLMADGRKKKTFWHILAITLKKTSRWYG